ncbi:MAG: rod shape-determining protein MreC [Parcubacteria group bacterium]|jgi:rod shape-determining protein MreC
MKFFSKKNKKFLWAVIFLIIVVFIFSRGGNNPVKGSVLYLTSPFLKTFRVFSGGTEGFFHFLGSIGDLKSENEKILEENKALLAKNALLKDIEGENKLLREQMELLPRKEYELESSFVIAQDPLGMGNYLFIDKGENSGIKAGMPVIVSKGILAGKITEVYPNSAKVVLVNEKSSAINSEIEESGAKGIVKGAYGLGLMMDMISQSEMVKEGDAVITSGLGGDMPRGLYIGKIKEVGQSADKLFQQSTIISPVDFSSLRVVSVIKKY